jgi:serine protease AprX
MIFRDHARTLALAALALLAAPAAIGAAAPVAKAAEGDASVPRTLAEEAEAAPAKTFDVIVHADAGTGTAKLAGAVDVTLGAGSERGVTRQFDVIDGVAARVTGAQLRSLARLDAVASITPDVPVVPSGGAHPQLWPEIAEVTSVWEHAGGDAPGIAIVDSGIDGTRADFAGRVTKQVDFTRGDGANARGDGFGHGTFVASLAAGAADGRAGFAPGAPLVSLDVFDDAGRGTTSSVIAAADWILQNRERYAIRVANFSLTGSQISSFRDDPLCKAVERLWLSGVVVVAAAGNYGAAGEPSGVVYAPGNDPFVITVGAADTNDTLPTGDDVAAPWSAHGATPDGFAKPELGAPGRYLEGAVPESASMYAGHPERVVAPGYMWMSGTSFAAPIVAGAAAALLAAHPDWTPDDVKGALMLTAAPAADRAGGALGVGEVKAAQAAAVEDPPNPNLALRRFVVPSGNGRAAPAFDAAAWTREASSDASWSSATWAGASWSSASWSSASWSSAAWSSASWSSASWSSGSRPDGTLPASTEGMWKQ